MEIAAPGGRPASPTGCSAGCGTSPRCGLGRHHPERGRPGPTALEIDHLGLDAIDHRMLRSIMENYRGGPVGLETLAATINEEAVTLEDVYEPYLMQLGFLTRTPGAAASPQGLSAPGAADARGRGRRRTGPAELLNRKGRGPWAFGFSAPPRPC